MPHQSTTQALASLAQPRDDTTRAMPRRRPRVIGSSTSKPPQHCSTTSPHSSTPSLGLGSSPISIPAENTETFLIFTIGINSSSTLHFSLIHHTYSFLTP